MQVSNEISRNAPFLSIYQFPFCHNKTNLDMYSKEIRDNGKYANDFESSLI